MYVDLQCKDVPVRRDDGIAQDLLLGFGLLALFGNARAVLSSLHRSCHRDWTCMLEGIARLWWFKKFLDEMQMDAGKQI